MTRARAGPAPDGAGIMAARATERHADLGIASGRIRADQRATGQACSSAERHIGARTGEQTIIVGS